MKNLSTLILRVAIGIIALISLAISSMLVSLLFRSDIDVSLPIVLLILTSVIPFLYALYHMFRLLGHIDKNRAFSQQSVKILMRIKYAAAIITAIYTLGLPAVYMVADYEDAPGIMVVGLFVAFVAFNVTTFAGVAQKLFQNAVDIKKRMI